LAREDRFKLRIQVRRRVLKYGPGKKPGIDPPDEVDEAIYHFRGRKALRILRELRHHIGKDLKQYLDRERGDGPYKRR